MFKLFQIEAKFILLKSHKLLYHLIIFPVKILDPNPFQIKATPRWHNSVLFQNIGV